MEHQFDVLVLGSGVAGLQAARTLLAAGRRVAVIEARNRTGGRILTRHVASPFGGAGIVVELGAEFVHGKPPETWRLIQEAGLASYELDGAVLSFTQRKLQAAHEESSAASVLGDMIKWLAKQPNGTDVTFAQYLDRAAIAEPQKAEAIRYVEGFNAADHRLIGAAALARQQDAEDKIDAHRLFRLSAGYESLPRFLQSTIAAAGGSIYLNKPVGTIEWRPNAVTMSGTDMSGRSFAFSGERAVITLPLGVIQAKRVDFLPHPMHVLPEAARMAMGPVVRVPLVFGSRFWCSEGARARNPGLGQELNSLSFLFSDRGVPAAWWTPHPDPAPVVTGWIAGPLAARFERASLLDQCLRSLADILGESAASLHEMLVGWHFHDWSADEFACGAYSYAPAGALSASANIAEPVCETLFFAGEHATPSGHWGTVHGALQSGEAAAQKVIAL